MRSLPTAATIIRRGFRWVLPMHDGEIVRLGCVHCSWEKGFTAQHGGGVVDEVTEIHSRECREDRLRKNRKFDGVTTTHQWHDEMAEAEERMVDWIKGAMDRWRAAGGR